MTDEEENQKLIEKYLPKNQNTTSIQKGYSEEEDKKKPVTSTFRK